MRSVIAKYMLEIRDDLDHAKPEDLLSIMRAEHDLVCHLVGELAALKLQFNMLTKNEPKK